MKWLSVPLLVAVLLSFPPELETARDKLKCSPRVLRGGRVRIRSRGRVIKYVCLRGYQVLGNKYSTCIRGQWDSPAPVCIKGGCEMVDVLNGQVLETYRGAFVTVHCDPGYQLVGTKGLYCNGAKWNDTIPYCKETNVTSQKWCDFESEDLCGWTHDLNHDFDWRRHNFATPSGHVGTGPSYDHTLGPGLNGHYLYLETSSPRLENDTARLFSPVFPAPSTSDTCFVFWYHMYGLTTGFLNVYLHHRDSILLFSQSGDQGNQWHQAVMSLPPLNTSYQIVIEGVRGTGYEGDIAIDDVKLGEGEECFSSTTTDVVQVSSSDVNDGASCKGRCFQITSEPHLCECKADCVANSTCCSDFLIECSYPSQGSVVVTTSSLPIVQEISSASKVHLDVPTTPLTTKLSGNTSSSNLTTSTVSTTTTSVSSKAIISSVNIQSTVKGSYFKSTIPMTSTQLAPKNSSLWSTENSKTTTVFKNELINDTNSSFTLAKNSTVQPPTKFPIRTPITPVFYQQSTSPKSTVASTKVPLTTISTKITLSSKLTISSTATKNPTTKPIPIFTKTTLKHGTSNTPIIRKIEFITPPPPVVYRTPTKTTTLLKFAKSTQPKQNFTIMFTTSTNKPKLFKTPTKGPSKSKNDVLHPSWRKRMPSSPPLPTLGPKPGYRTQGTKTSANNKKIMNNKLHENYLSDQPSEPAAKTKWSSKYEPRDKAPVHAQFSSATQSNEMIHILVMVAGVLLLLTSILATVCVVRRRKINRRSIEDDELDIRFLASDEILDFTLARPSMDDVCETRR